MSDMNEMQDTLDLTTALEPATFQTDHDIEENQLFLTPGQMILRRFFRNKLAVTGLVMLIVMALFCFVGPVFYPYNETELFYADKTTGAEIRTGESEKLSNATLSSLMLPNAKHLLGTNQMGQDMLARLMYGGRVSLLVGFLVVAVSLVIGMLLGGLAGYYGRFVNAIIMRVVDVISSVPFVPMMLIISALLISFGISPKIKIYYTMLIMGLISWTGIARMVRGNILSLRETEFMQAAEATGIRVRNRILKHLLPNTLPNLIVMATMDLGSVIMLESTLSFLGVGVGVPYSSWGVMVQAVNDNIVMRNFPNIWVAPGLCILLTVLAFNFVGDGLRDATDPRLKR